MKKLLALLSSIYVLTPFNVNAAPDLIDIYQQALANDTLYKQAYDSYMSAREAAPQAMSRLLPSLSITGYLNQVDSMSESSGRDSAIFNIESVFEQNNYTLTITQPVFNYALWEKEKQASQSVRQAQATFNSQAQDLVLRTSRAYFIVLLAKDNLRFAKAKKRANKRQLDQASQRFKVGIVAITDVYEAKAAFDSSRALVITEENNLVNQFENLRKLTNHTYKALDSLKDQHVPLIKPDPVIVDDWVGTALKQNYSLHAANFAKQAARTNIKVQNAGHLPTVNLQGSYSDTRSNIQVPSVPTRFSQGTIGLQLSFPVFQGGLVFSQTRQAVYDFKLAQEKFEETYREVIVKTRISFNNIIDGMSKIRADRQAVKSANNALESIEAQFKVGTRTMVDVVISQQALYEQQTRLATDQYIYIGAILQLKYYAGTLSAEDLLQINSWLQTQRHYKKKPPRPYASKQKTTRVS